MHGNQIFVLRDFKGTNNETNVLQLTRRQIACDKFPQWFFSVPLYSTGERNIPNSY
jgi:hypothetical protein